MNYIEFRSESRKTPFAPEWHYIMVEEMLAGIDFAEVAKLILSKEKDIIANHRTSNFIGNFMGTTKSVDGYTGLGPDSLTSRFEHYNLLAWDNPEIIKMRQAIKEVHNTLLMDLKLPIMPVWIQCWANVLRDGQKIDPHIHTAKSDCYLGGHITVQADNTDTVYISPINQINEPEVYASRNEVGKITLFQNNIPHYTTIHKGDRERITIAFDMHLTKMRDNNILL